MDPAVKASFVLGWRLAELYDRDSLPPPPGAPQNPQLPLHLPGASEMSDYSHALVLLRQAQAALATLAPSVGQLPGLDNVREALDYAEHHRDDVRREIMRSYVNIQGALLGEAPRLALSYGLGRLLADTTWLPRSKQPATFAERFDPFRLGNARNWLDDLANSFDPRAAAATTASVDAWEDWVRTRPRKDGAIDAAALDEHAVRCLHAQGELWRRLLSGEKDAMQLLGPQDYVAAGERLLQRAWQLTAGYLRQWWPVIAVFLAATAAAIWAALTYAPTGTDRVTAVIVSAAAALGVSWKGVGATLGKALGQAESALWSSEVEVAVGKAATILPRERRKAARLR